MLEKKRNDIPTVDLTDNLETNKTVKRLPVEDLRRRTPTRERKIKNVESTEENPLGGRHLESSAGHELLAFSEVLGFMQEQLQSWDSSDCDGEVLKVEALRYCQVPFEFLGASKTVSVPMDLDYTELS